VKWCPTQHALPRSAILTEIISGVEAPVDLVVDGEAVVLFKEILLTSSVIISLQGLLASSRKNTVLSTYAVFSL
jgi:hypothetical protein